MEQQEASCNNDKTTTTEGDYNISQLTAVASKWILDFLFAAICRRFKERNHDAFNDAISTYETISQTPLLEGGISEEKTLICAFLARVMQGKQLDTRFDDDDGVMPLMSAAMLWLHLKDVVADEGLFENVTVHLIIQSVAVCLEKGQRTLASGALKWFEEHIEYSQKVGAKLSAIVAQMDTYHPFLTVFSFERLLELAQTFVDAFLAKHPSDFLFKEAIKVVQSSQSVDAADVAATEDASLLEKSDRARLEKETKPNLKVTVGKNPCVSLRWQSANELLSSDVSAAADEQSVDDSEDAALSQDGSLKNDVKQSKLRSTKSGHASGRRLYSNNSSQLDTSPYPAADRKAKTAPWNVRLSGDKTDQSGESTIKSKRTLLSAQTKPWEPDGGMQPQVKDVNNAVVRPKKTHQKWTSTLDVRLVRGVRRHGKGKWLCILQDYDFEGRTGTMLKDRWRILEKTHKVD
ncbi:telomeric repeat-binding factor 1 [Vanacampus margaritifer]